MQAPPATVGGANLIGKSVYSFGLTDYDRQAPPKLRRPSWTKQYLGQLTIDPKNRLLHQLGDTERLVSHLLIELAVEYKNRIPWDRDILAQRLLCKQPINWQSLYDADIIHFYEGVPVDMVLKHSQNGVDVQTKRRMTLIVNNFNKMAERCQIPRVREVKPDSRSSSRWTQLKARAADDQFFQDYTKALDIVLHSAFCNGEKGWVLTIDFFIKKNSLSKIIQGDYGLPNGDEKYLTVNIVRDGKTTLMPPSKVKPTDVLLGRY